MVTIREPISKSYEIAALLKQLEPRPVLFETVTESEFRVIGNLFCNKSQFADYFGLELAEIIPTLTEAITSPPSPPAPLSLGEGRFAPCQEVIHLNPDLDKLPIPLHFSGDGGNYITAGVVIAKHPEYGQNMDFHRCMQFSPTKMAVRVVKGRHFHHFLDGMGQVDVAICVGNSPDILAAAASFGGPGRR